MESSRTPNKLKFFRLCKGYSQKKVARLLGLADTASLSRWEHGIATPSLMQLFRLSRIYNTLPHELYEGLWNQCTIEESLLTQGGESFNINPLSVAMDT